MTNGPVNDEKFPAVSTFLLKMERYCVEEGSSENQATSLVVCFHTFFTI